MVRFNSLIYKRNKEGVTSLTSAGPAMVAGSGNHVFCEIAAERRRGFARAPWHKLYTGRDL
jgi:hypothetical protein